MQNSITCINIMQFATWIHCPPHRNLDKVPPQSCSQKRVCCATLQVPSPHHLLFWSRPMHSDHLPVQPPSHTLPSHASCTHGTAHPSDSYLKQSNTNIFTKSKTQKPVPHITTCKTRICPSYSIHKHIHNWNTRGANTSYSCLEHAQRLIPIT